MTGTYHLDTVSTAANPIDIKALPMIGGGEMGQRVRETDWSATPLGACATWPQSLITLVRVLLLSRQPMFVAWGPERVLVYNDSYADILGAKHPWALGFPLVEVWSENWSDIESLVDSVFAGKSVHIDDLCVNLHRNGDPEEAHFAFSYTPILNDDGRVEGLLCVCTETTRQVMADRAERRVRARLETAIKLAKLGTHEWHPLTGHVEMSAQSRDLFALPPTGQILDTQVFDRIAPDDRARVQAEAMAAVGFDGSFSGIDVGDTIDFSYDLLRPDGSKRSVESSGAIIENPDGTRWMIGTFNDVTDIKRAQADLQDLNATLERRVAALATERDQLWRLSRDPFVVCDLEGRWISASPVWTEILGWDQDDLLGRTSAWMDHPDDHDKTRQKVIDVGDGEVMLAFTNRFRGRNGSYRTFSWTAVSEGDRLFCVARDVTDEVERAAVLRQYENIIQSNASPICAFDLEYRLIAFNQAHADEFFRIYGYRVQIGDVFPDLFLLDQARIMRGFMTRALAGEVFTVTEEFGHPDLTLPCWEVSYNTLRAEDGRIVGAFHHAKDISERLQAQAELVSTQDALRQSQKMEAVGQLTGGLAHDFNNLLTGISGSLDLLQKRVAQGRFNDLDRYVVAAQGASKRAAALTHRLLAFSRRQTLDPKPTDVSKLIKSMADLIRRTVGPEIAIEIVDMVGLWTALVDPNQLENALLNLAINARDAMPDGGRITVETDNKWMDERAARERDLQPGQYLSICLSDTGTGMPPDVVARAFDPFYTTKPLGLGTGLGLSMIYGFARQSGGMVRIYSEVGQGTTVCIYLPRHYGDEEAATPHGQDEVRGAEIGEIVLIVDDEATIRMLVTDVLSDLGYGALEAEDGAAGLRILRSNARIDLLVTDVGLPNGMNGRQVADAAREIRPGLKVLFITGYAQNAVVGNGHLDPGMSIMTKPFAMDDLAVRIRSLIEG